MVDIGNDADTTWFIGERGGSLDFGEHGAGFEAAGFDVSVEFLGSDFVDWRGLRSAVIDICIWDGSDRNEDVGFNFFGETFGGEIFVDDGVNAFEAF